MSLSATRSTLSMAPTPRGNCACISTLSSRLLPSRTRETKLCKRQLAETLPRRFSHEMASITPVVGLRPLEVACLGGAFGMIDDHVGRRCTIQAVGPSQYLARPAYPENTRRLRSSGRGKLAHGVAYACSERRT